MTKEECFALLLPSLIRNEEAGKEIPYAEAIETRHDLTPLRSLLNRLGNPDEGPAVIHIAGSNGKGSVAASLQNILTLASYKTALYTSPHLEKMNERISINGEDISDEDLYRLCIKVREESEKIYPTPNAFDLLTAVAFLYFQEQQVDFLILEVGLGGRLDSTNVVKSKMLSIICHIALEHTEILGNSLEKIAEEKGGIITADTPVLLMRQKREVEEVIRRIAHKKNAPFLSTNPHFLHSYPFHPDNGYQYFSYKERKEYALSLLGDYQLDNAMVILDTVDYLKSSGYRIPEEAVKLGLYTVQWRGRFEVLKRNPLFILDGAHNPQAMTAVVRSVEMLFPHYKKRVFFSVMADKDYSSMLRILKRNSLSFTFYQVDRTRGKKAEDLVNEWKEEYDGEIHIAKSLEEGLAFNLDKMKKENGRTLLLSVGSLYQVAAIRNYCKENL